MARLKRWLTNTCLSGWWSKHHREHIRLQLGWSKRDICRKEATCPFFFCLSSGICRSLVRARNLGSSPPPMYVNSPVSPGDSPTSLGITRHPPASKQASKQASDCAGNPRQDKMSKQQTRPMSSQLRLHANLQRFLCWSWRCEPSHPFSGYTRQRSCRGTSFLCGPQVAAGPGLRLYQERIRLASLDFSYEASPPGRRGSGPVEHAALGREHGSRHYGPFELISVLPSDTVAGWHLWFLPCLTFNNKSSTQFIGNSSNWWSCTGQLSFALLPSNRDTAR